MVYGHIVGLLLAVSLQALADTWTQNQSPPPSPCPSIFQYQVDPGGIWSGLINVPTLEPDFNVKLKVELGLDAVLPTPYAGKIQLVEHKYEVWRRLVTGDKRPVQYRVYFPLSWPLPVVKHIASNQNVLCAANSQPTITKLSLEHTLYPIRLNGFLDQIEANKNNPAIQGNNRSNINLQEQNIKVYYQQYPPQTGSSQGNDNGNFNLQNQNVKIYYHQYQPGNENDNVKLNDQDVRIYYQQHAPSQQQYQPVVNYQPGVSPQQNQSITYQDSIQYQPGTPPQQNVQYQQIGPHQPVSQRQPVESPQTVPQLEPGTPQKLIPSQPVEYDFRPSVQPSQMEEPVKPAQPIPANTEPPPHLTPPPRTRRPTTTTTTQAPEKILEDECGISMTEAVPLVINGLPTARGEWPWLVAMFVKSRSVGLQFQCGGSLLSRTIVLTAAHCVKYRDKPEVKADSIVLYMGKFNLEQWTETSSQARDVEKVHFHPDYKSNDRKSEADLAVLVLKEAVEYTIYVRPVCLWIFSSDINQIVGQTGTVVGWGKDETGATSVEPHMVSMPIVSHGTCVLSNKEFFYYVTNRTFCAGMRDGTGPCSGDSGGGFMIGYQEGNAMRWYLRGVVHLSLYDRQNQQCDLKSYLIYTDVAMFMDWIREFVP